jgi:hypothetical protein
MRLPWRPLRGRRIEIEREGIDFREDRPRAYLENSAGYGHEGK